MKFSLALAVFGLVLAFVDMFGFADALQRGARSLVDHLRRSGNWLAMKATPILRGATSEWVLWPVVVLMGLCFYIRIDPAPLITGFVLVVLLLAGVFLVPWVIVVSIEGFFAALSWPKRGIVSTLGLALAAVGVLLEMQS